MDLEKAMHICVFMQNKLQLKQLKDKRKLSFKKYMHIHTEIYLFNFKRNQGFRWKKHCHDATKITLPRSILGISLPL